MPSETDLRRILLDSLTLYERRDGMGEARGERSPGAERRFARWVDSAAKGDATQFRRRLAEDGLDEALLADDGGRQSAEAPLPPWLEFFAASLTGASAWNKDRIFAPPETGTPPFFPLVRPFVEAAFERLRERCPELRAPARWASLAGPRAALIHALSHQAAFAFNLEFTIYRAKRESGLAGALRRASGVKSDSLLRPFILEFFAGGWTTFFREYAVLARQLSTLAIDWADSVGEMLERLESDRPTFEVRFNGGASLGAPATIEIGLSDRHRGARTTAVLTWKNGLRIVYKPKPLDTDMLLADVVAWINRTAALFPMETVPTISRDTHGWQLFAENRPCADQDAVNRFYTRAGYLLALAYVFEAYDLHHENLIACGEQPYLIDTETIFSPYADRVGPGEGAARLANETVYYSVMRTGLLPSWSIGSGGDKRDTSGFGGASVEGNDDRERSAWVGVGTDDIRLEPRTVPVERLANEPCLEGGSGVQADDHVDDIRSGFAAMYEFLAANGDRLLEIVEAHADARIRFVRRPTNLYAQQLWKLCNPQFLRSGIDWSIETDHLARMLLGSGAAPHAPWGLLRAEHEALYRLDIPYFYVTAAGVDVRDGFGAVRAAGFFSHSCLDRMRRKLARLDAADRALQERYIDYTFQARSARGYHDMPDAVAALVATEKSPEVLPPVPPQECIAIAEEVAAELARQAIYAGDGSAAWISLEYVKEAGVHQFKPLSYNLYGGSLGVAVFLAALANVTVNDDHARLAAAAVKPLLTAIETDLPSLVRYGSAGGGTGLGSILYGLASVAALLPDRQVAEAAERAAVRCAVMVDDAFLARDDKLDLIFGSAGLLLGLERLHRLGPRDETVAAVTRTANYLLAHRRQLGRWELIPTYSGQAITGVSHGSAGVALALARAWSVTDDESCLAAAADHIAFEDDLFDPERCNYPDYRSTPAQLAFLTCWCHGAPGIGLSRLAIHRLTGDASLLPSIESAMDVASRFTLNHIDHLCCGNMGRIDIQLEHACETGDDAAIERLRRDAAHVVRRYREEGSFRLLLNARGTVFSPGLFTGVAGIGYGLLRLARPGALPSVLAYD